MAPGSDSGFSADVLDHFLHPRNVGKVDNPTAVSELENEICGDRMEMSARVVSGKFASIKFQSEGCAVAMAAASKITEAVTGRLISEADRLAQAAVASVKLGTNNEKEHCLQIVQQVWQELLRKVT
jgi:NifU-like protein involved in Fe-S cluster formation